MTSADRAEMIVSTILKYVYYSTGDDMNLITYT